jgi:phage baseplate assembly protein W
MRLRATIAGGCAMHLNFPFTLHRGVVDQPDSHEAYVEQLIEQVLFTVPGERVNRPDFGCGIQNMVFQPGNTEVVAAALFIVRSQLERQLAGIIRVEHVEATMTGGELLVAVQYTDPASAQRRTALFRR